MYARVTRKRKVCDATDTAPRKRRAQTVNNQGNKHESTRDDDPPVTRQLLSLYYPRIITLRQFLVSSLPLSSIARRRRVSTYGSDSQAGTRQHHYFDSTLIGVLAEPQATVQEARKHDFVAFTHLQQRSTDSSNGNIQSIRFAEVSRSLRHDGSDPESVLISDLEVLTRSDRGICHLDAFS